MPNLLPPVTNLASLINYRERILKVLPKDISFNPMMTFYLNEQLSPDDLFAAQQYPFITGAKLYPAGATTNSAAGVVSLRSVYPLLEVMQDCNLVLQIHGEVTAGDIFEREEAFISDYLQPLIKDFPRLRIVLEHISTKAAVDFVTNSPDTVAATITPHHLYYNRNHLLAGGIRPHYYCLPILKHERDQHALQLAATSGNPKFFAGTDSAPHSQGSKENSCGCAGVYSSPFAIAFYASIFEQLQQLARLNGFLSQYGAQFYQVPVNSGQLVLVKKQQSIPAVLPFGNEWVVPMAAGETLSWSIHESI